MKNKDKTAIAIIALANKVYDEEFSGNTAYSKNKKIDALNRSSFAVGFQKAVAMASDQTLVPAIKEEMNE